MGRIWHRSTSHTGSLHEPLSYISRQMIADVYADTTRRPLSVCFTGHRHISADVAYALAERMDILLERLYEKGYRDFLSGGARGFDLLAAERVLALRHNHPDVRLMMVIPCGNQTQRWPEQDCRRYERILYAADENRVLAPYYYQGCMQVRNRHMVDHSALCVCYMAVPRGGTLSTVTYALKAAVPVVNLAMKQPLSCSGDDVPQVGRL
ncbi:MAG: SLOG family protein [Aristaeellaceae bacterium]